MIRNIGRYKCHFLNLVIEDYVNFYDLTRMTL
jgi:hypothetical protein